MWESQCVFSGLIYRYQQVKGDEVLEVNSWWSLHLLGWLFTNMRKRKL